MLPHVADFADQAHRLAIAAARLSFVVALRAMLVPEHSQGPQGLAP